MPSSTTYTVASGDTLGSISSKFDTTVSAIAAANNIQNQVVISQRLMAEEKSVTNPRTIRDDLLLRDYPNWYRVLYYANFAVLLSFAIYFYFVYYYRGISASADFAWDSFVVQIIFFVILVSKFFIPKRKPSS